MNGTRLVDLNDSNLHIVNFSVPIDREMTFRELSSNLFYLENLPEAIPYRTSYYSENWGFCVTKSQFDRISEEKRLKVVIDSTIEPGSLTYGEAEVGSIGAKKYLERIHDKNNWTFVYLLHKINFFKTAKIYLKDLDLPIKFNLLDGIRESDFSNNDADIITDSDSLAFALKFDYGADTLLANARFRTSGGRTMNFFRLFMIGTLNNNGRRFPFGIIGFLLREKSMWKTLFIEAILGNYDFK